VKSEIPNPYPTPDCFFCGSENADGLHLAFFWDDERREASCEYVPTRRFAGQGDILHGAIQMGLLDEIMGWTSVRETGEMTVTLELNTTFLRPLYISDGLVGAVCRVVAVEGRTVRLEAELKDRQGAVCTTAAGVFRALSAERYNALVMRR